MKNVFSEGDVQFPVFVDVGNNDNYCPLNYTYGGGGGVQIWTKSQSKWSC